MGKKISLSMLVLGTLFISGCGLYNNPQKSSVSPITPTPIQVSPKASISVNIRNFAFTPATLTVKKGTTVTWTNADSAPHQIKSSSFNSEILNNGQSFSYTFNDVGNFDYLCAIHPYMVGKIVVE